MQGEVEEEEVVEGGIEGEVEGNMEEVVEKDIEGEVEGDMEEVVQGEGEGGGHGGGAQALIAGRPRAEGRREESGGEKKRGKKRKTTLTKCKGKTDEGAAAVSNCSLRMTGLMSHFTHLYTG